MSENRKFTTKQLVIIAMLVALNVILSRFLSIAAWNIKIGFAYFPGFTITAAIVGLIYGLFLSKKQTMPRILGAVLATEIIGSLLLNTLWISVLYGSPFLPLMATRVFQCLILGIVEIVVIRIMAGLVPRLVHSAS